MAGRAPAGGTAVCDRLLLMQHWGPGSRAALVQASAEPCTHLNLSGGSAPEVWNRIVTRVAGVQLCELG